MPISIKYAAVTPIRIYLCGRGEPRLARNNSVIARPDSSGRGNLNLCHAERLSDERQAGSRSMKIRFIMWKSSKTEIASSSGRLTGNDKHVLVRASAVGGSFLSK